MAEKSGNKKSAPAKKTEAKKTAPKAEAEVAETKKKTQTEAEKPAETKNSTQSVVIAVLATVLVCLVLVFGVLLATGVIKFGGDDDRYPDNNGTSQTRDGKSGPSEKKANGGDDDDAIIENTYPKVKVNGTLATVKDLEFYLPKQFEAGGKNNDGAYTYNLVNDDGWAQVLVYAEKSNLSPKQFLLKIGPYLDITDDDYEINGTEWVQGENASALAYATELDGVIYAVYYSVKLDSDATSEAMQMIPKTLYMKRIYAD